MDNVCHQHLLNQESQNHLPNQSDKERTPIQPPLSTERPSLSMPPTNPQRVKNLQIKAAKINYTNSPPLAKNMRSHKLQKYPSKSKLFQHT